jgi:hypothetical protein
VVENVGHFNSGDATPERRQTGEFSLNSVEKSRRLPKLSDGWALPLLQRRLEIALLVEVTKNIVLRETHT